MLINSKNLPIYTCFFQTLVMYEKYRFLRITFDEEQQMKILLSK